MERELSLLESRLTCSGDTLFLELHDVSKAPLINTSVEHSLTMLLREQAEGIQASLARTAKPPPGIHVLLAN